MIRVRSKLNNRPTDYFTKLQNWTHNKMGVRGKKRYQTKFAWQETSHTIDMGFRQMVENARLLEDQPKPKRMCTESEEGGVQVKTKKNWEEKIKNT